MALKKSITTENGIPINYHKVESISNTDTGIFVSIHSYIDESYRKKEIEKNEKIIKTGEYIEERNEILSSSDYDSAENVKRLQELDELINEGISAQTDGAGYVYTSSFCFQKDDEISFSNVYEQLKKTETFEGASDC